MTALNKQALREAASPEAVMALLDELEAAEKRIAELRGYNVDLAEESRQYQQRVAELEAREVVIRQFDEFSICHFGASEDYAKGYIDCQKNYNKALGAASILVSIKGE